MRLKNIIILLGIFGWPEGLEANPPDLPYIQILNPPDAPPDAPPDMSADTSGTFPTPLITMKTLVTMGIPIVTNMISSNSLLT
jgi:hypothetical protein